MAVTVREVEFGIWEFSFVTHASPEASYDYILGFDRHVEWEEDLASVQSLGRASPKGARYKKTYNYPPGGSRARTFSSRTYDFTCVITALERPSHLAWEERHPDPEGNDDVHTCDFYIEPDGTGSRVMPVLVT